MTRIETLAVVQARGGSKGLPRKNLRLLRGHPLIAYSIASGLAARSVTRLLVTTDDEEIAEVSRAYGAEVPYLRPAELALDDTPDFPVFEHALAWLAKHESYHPEVVVQLRPTTPLRPRGMIDEASRILAADPAADCVRGVTVPKQTPYKMWRDGEDGCLAPLLDTSFPEPYNMPRQKLPPAYWQTGHVDVIRTPTILQKQSLTGTRVRPIMIDGNYCVDIDTLVDFDLAERAIEQKHLDIDTPRAVGAAAWRPWPATIEMLVFDFDGVFTDNRVYVFQDGREAVACNRGDGMGLSMLVAQNLPIVVLSTEVNPVVAARCRKLRLEYQHGLADKRAALVALAAEKKVDLRRVVYVGNDVNDLGCMEAAGFAVAVADAHPAALAKADLVLSNRGGDGAVRELCDLLLQHMR
ncbi:MAG TPA: acylneuraminate cytidylyltransferase [Pirellulales bacterium]|nr:acylneuraminate cytidylyltransferase [Pirellulales bacterium]